MTVMLRFAATPRLLYRFYCMFLPSTVLFWPARFGDLVLILNAEAKEDHKFGDLFIKQMLQHYPEFKLRIVYEDLPHKPDLFKSRGVKTVSYNRQLWSTFFADLYTNDSVIVYMDTDAVLRIPMTKEYMLNGTKLKVLGNGNLAHGFNPKWAAATLKTLGLPSVANFMITFPQLIYRDTYKNCREYIMKHLNVSSFEEAFSRFYTEGDVLSPINVIMSYAWYFEKHRYDWHLKIKDLKSYNQRLPEGHAVTKEDVVPSIIGAAHFSGKKELDPGVVIPGYCQALRAQGQASAKCRTIKHDANTICDFFEMEHRSPWPAGNDWCAARNLAQCCQQAVDDHYNNVGRMFHERVHEVVQSKAKLVGKLANEMGVVCEELPLP